MSERTPRRWGPGGHRRHRHGDDSSKTAAAEIELISVEEVKTNVAAGDVPFEFRCRTLGDDPSLIEDGDVVCEVDQLPRGTGS